MSQLDGGRGRHEPAVPRIAELPGEQHEHRAEALAARVDQVQRGLGKQGLLGARRIPDDGLDTREALEDVRLDGGIGEVDWYGTGHAGSNSRHTRPGTSEYARYGRRRHTGAGPGGGAMVLRQRTNRWVAALFARLRTGSGMMPRNSVTAAPTATAVPVSTLGTTTAGPSGRGSLKNITTMTRT